MRYTYGMTYLRTSNTERAYKYFVYHCFSGHLFRKFRPEFWYMYAVNLVVNGLNGEFVGLDAYGLVQVIGISVLNVTPICFVSLFGLY
jgi:hypothetical protein